MASNQKSSLNMSKEKAIAILTDHAGSRLLTHLNSCVHCGLCAESCQYYRVYKDDRYIPAHKVELVASLYRRKETFAGKYLPWLVGARDLDQGTLDEMTDLLFGACTLCGRCVPHCSIGVDIAYVVQQGRAMLAAMGMVPETLQATVDAALNTGNNMGISTEEFVDTIEWMQEELQAEVEDENAIIPLDQPGKKVMYTLNPREPKFFPLSIAAMAKIFYAAKEEWTISTKMYDVTNYAFFSGDLGSARVIAQRMTDEMHSLGAQRCVLAECGHGSRAYRWEAPNYLDMIFDFDVLTSVELILEYIEQGRIKLDPAKNPEPVTLHDPCHLVRTGGIIHHQREILRHAVTTLIEMTPYGSDNFCCGGGGGALAMSEYNERRMKTAEIKADQITRTGAGIVVTPCHNCVDQLIQINGAFRLGVQVKTLAEIVADALVLE
jgi:Fe-S oxidoreductase